MNLDNNNKDHKVGDSTYALLEEADELARRRNCTGDFALYVMYRQALTAGDNARAIACMNLLERKVMNALSDPVFLDANKENDQVG
jgi:uncharacterized protein (DUF1778 family)